MASSIPAKVSTEQEAAIRGILSRVTFDAGGKAIRWGLGDWIQVRQLTKAIYRYRPSGGCPTCHLKALNLLREAVGIPPIGGEASESLRTRRLAICRGVAPDGSDACPAYHPATDSCGRLLVDAFAHEPVTDHDGTFIHPCGCAVAVKATFKMFQCPARKWPFR